MTGALFVALLPAGGCSREEAVTETPAVAETPTTPPAPRQTITKEAPPPTVGTAHLVEEKTIDETQLGVPVYPGARRIESGRWQMTDALAEGADALTFIELQTTDGFDDVARFYRERIDSEPEQSFEIDNARGRTASLTTTLDELASVNIVLRSRAGEPGTRIEINRLSLDTARAVPDKQPR